MALILTVRFYRSMQGVEPVREWLQAMPKAARRAIGEDVKTVQMGWPLGMPLVRKVTPGLWEVRSRIPTGIARVLFTVQGNEMVLLHGFVKKSSKAPKTDMETARRRKSEVDRG